MNHSTTADAATIIMRLFRALDRLDTGLTPQQYRILRLAGGDGERSARLAERCRGRKLAAAAAPVDGRMA